MRLNGTRQPCPGRSPAGWWLPLLLVTLLGGRPVELQAAYPEKPIVVVVHTKPGGAIDLTARLLAKVARRYVDVPLVIENRYGGSGALAMRTVLARPADGYTLLAVPATFISTIQITSSDYGLDDFHFLACLIEAPEALIVNRRGRLTDLAAVVADAQGRPGRQIWVGPGVGSLDHLMAVKTWQKLGIDAIWVPYDGGGEAVAALLGGHGDVYVGNPEDVRGRPDLRIAAVSAPGRLPLFPDVPTLTELGYDLPHEIMWRGFAVRRGTPPAVTDFLEDLLRRVAADSEWVNFVQASSALPVFRGHDEFTALVDRDSREAARTLRLAGILAGDDPARRRLQWLGWSCWPLVALGIGLALRRRGRRPSGSLVVAGSCLALAGLFAVLAVGFPPPSPGQAVGPATIPWLWAAGLALFALLELRTVLHEGETAPRGRVAQAGLVAGLMVMFVLLLPRAGFAAATALLLLGSFRLLGYRRWPVALVVTVAVLVFCRVVFVKTLGLPLPTGSWWS